MGARDSHIDEIAAARRPREMNNPVAARSPFQQPVVETPRAVDQHLERPSDQAAVASDLDRLLQRQEFSETRLLDVLRKRRVSTRFLPGTPL